MGPRYRTALLLAAAALALATGPAAAGEPAPGGAAARARFQALVEAGDLEAVLKAADDALRADAESVLGWEYRAFALHRLGRFTEAREAYRRLVAKSPNYAWAWTQIGTIELELGRPVDAWMALDRATELAPSSLDSWTKLVRVLRELRDYPEALAAVGRAEAAKVDPLWCALEAASIAWAAGDAEDARRRTDRADALGADREAVANLRRLVAFDAALPAADRARFQDGRPWEVAVGPFVVETRVASRLPDGVEKALTQATSRFAGFLGVSGVRDLRVRLVLARTLEEHEAVRRTLFPGAPTGGAFTVGGGGGRRSDAAVTMYAAWTQPGIERSVAHEAAHAFLRARGVDGPPWLDEGLATYLEGWAVGEDRGAARKDLVAELCAGRTDERLLPWAELASGGAALFRRGEARLRYAQSWLLVHWICHGDGGPGETKLRRLLDGAWRLQGPAFHQALGTSAERMTSSVDAHLTKLSKAK